MLIEFGDEMNLDFNFMGQSLASALAGGTIAGVVETAPCFATTLIHYEPEIIAFAGGIDAPFVLGSARPFTRPVSVVSPRSGSCWAPRQSSRAADHA